MWITLRHNRGIAYYCNASVIGCQTLYIEYWRYYQKIVVVSPIFAKSKVMKKKVINIINTKSNNSDKCVNKL